MHPYQLGQGTYSFANTNNRSVLMTCEACAHHSYAPFPDDEYLNQIYSGSYFGTGEEAFFEQNYHSYNIPLAKDLQQVAAAAGLRADFRLHEFGCGLGTTVYQLNQLGVRATGSDWSTGAISFGQKMGNAALSVGSKGEIAGMLGEAIDLVFTNHVLEHLTDPLAFLREIGTLGKGIHFYSRLPNGYDYTTRQFSMLVSPWFYYPHHLHQYSVDSIRCLLLQAGFRPQYVRSTPRSDNVLAFISPDKWPVPNDREASVVFLTETNQSEEIEFMAVYEGGDLLAEADLPVRAEKVDQDRLFTHRALNMETFPAEGGAWSRCFSRSPGHSDGAMVYHPPGNYYYYDQAEIAPFWMFHGYAGTEPMLVWTADASRLYDLKLTVFPLVAEQTDATLDVYLADRQLARLAVAGAFPTEPTRLALDHLQVNAGETLRFVLHQAPEDKAHRRFGVFVDIADKAQIPPKRVAPAAPPPPSLFRRAKDKLRRMIRRTA